MQRRTKVVENIRNIKTGLAFPILSAIMPVTEEHMNWKRKTIENTDESSTKESPFCFKKIPRKTLGIHPPEKKKKKKSQSNREKENKTYLINEEKMLILI